MILMSLKIVKELGVVWLYHRRKHIYNNTYETHNPGNKTSNPNDPKLVHM
jgi:hypothetical protein